ncbi:MAG: hypothetical protein F6K55_34760 [Moorea sp. SIO4A3]|nr:hypothetical protein [Moorena sp. SIO4A3]
MRSSIVSWLKAFVMRSLLAIATKLQGVKEGSHGSCLNDYFLIQNAKFKIQTGIAF